MNEVFEKIIDRLEHLLNNFGEHCEEWGENKDCHHKSCSDCVLHHAIEIVKQEAEQYNNGWIPCSERLPDEHKLYDITFKNSAGIHSDSAIYNPYLKRWLWDADETELVENEILAWAEKREPFQPKGE